MIFELREPNLVEYLLYAVEREAIQVGSLARLVADKEARTLLYESTKRMQELIPLLLESLALCENAGITQSQREARVAEYNGDISLVNQDMYLEIG